MHFNIRNYATPKGYSPFTETEVPALVVKFQDFTVTNEEAKEILAHDTFNSCLTKKGKDNTTYEQLYLLVLESAVTENPADYLPAPIANRILNGNPFHTPSLLV